MSHCPTDVQLWQLLVGQLAPTDSAQLSPHIADCSSCQQRLDVLTSDSDSNRPTPLPDAAPSEPALAQLLSKLRSAPLAGSLTQRELKFPGPATAEAPLGQLGRYHILRRLGGGASGLLFQARDSRLQRTIALKVLRPELAALTSARQRFEREARAAAALQHENVVTLYAVASPADFPPYLVMEFIAGETLAQRLDKGPLPPPEAARLVLEAAQGLHAAHARGLVHRDVKPSNILVEHATGRAKVTDFGLALGASADGGTLTHSGQVLGTPAYMSPEQAVGQSHAVDARSDVYGLGAVLYHLLTGQPPFNGDTRTILYQAVHAEPAAPRKFRPAVPRDLETIALQCLAKDADRRYASAGELAADLQRWLRGEAIRARPIGGMERLLRWGRRNPALVAVSTVAAGLLVAVAVVSSWAASKAEPLALPPVVVVTDDTRSQFLEALRLGQEAMDVDDWTKANKHFQAALIVAEKRAQADPGSRQAKHDLLTVCKKLGDTADSWEDTQTHYDRALTLAQELTGMAPQDREVQKALCTAYEDLGRTCKERGQRDRSEEMFNQCDRVYDALVASEVDPDEEYLLRMMRVDMLADRGRHLDIAAIAEQLRVKDPKDPDNLYDVGCCYSLCVRAVTPGRRQSAMTAEQKTLRDQYIKQALALLGAAIDAGFDDAKLMQQDIDLKPLRELPAFRKLLNRIRNAVQQ